MKKDSILLAMQKLLCDNRFVGEGTVSMGRTVGIGKQDFEKVIYIEKIRIS